MIVIVITHILLSFELILNLEYFSIIEILDPGFSQFRGLTLYQLFLGEYHLLFQDKLKLENILESERKVLRETLELCMRCLSVELESSTSGRVYTRAKGYLELINQTNEKS